MGRVEDNETVTVMLCQIVNKASVASYLNGASTLPETVIIPITSTIREREYRTVHGLCRERNSEDKLYLRTQSTFCQQQSLQSTKRPN